MSKTIERAVENAETGLKMSKITYKQKNGKKKITEKIQGKANVPQRSNLQKDRMIQAHHKLLTGVELYAPDIKSKIMNHRVTFVDDRTEHVTGNSEEDNTTKDLSDRAKNAQNNAQMWYNLTRLNGRLVALHKKIDKQSLGK